MTKTTSRLGSKIDRRTRRRSLAQLARSPAPAAAFCGFYVAKADTKLFNKSSKVVLARRQPDRHHHGERLRGRPKEFALVIPVPTFIERKQIGVVEMKTIDHLDRLHRAAPGRIPRPGSLRAARA